MTDLSQAAFDYGYEVGMMVGALNGLWQLAPGGAKPTDPTRALLYNALLETILVHARALIEFHVPQFSDDIKPVMFLQDKVVDDDVVKRLRAVKTQIDKRVMHLTRNRSKPLPDGGWKPVAIVRDVITVVERFLEDVTRRYPDREDWFAQAREACDVFRADYA